MKNLFILIILITLCSCSTNKMSNNDLYKIDGIYNANIIADENIGAYNNNFIMLINRKLLWDTIKEQPIFEYKFELRVLDKKHLQIDILDKKEKVLDRRKYSYKKKQEFIHLKNQNTKPILIPYVAGALDVTKLKLRPDQNGNLNVTIGNHRSGGAFLIPMGWSNTTTVAKFRRIK
jgi:hypothetical protein